MSEVKKSKNTILRTIVLYIEIKYYEKISGLKQAFQESHTK